MPNSVAVILPTYNNLDSLKQCLSSLEAQTVSDFTVYICIDGSTDGTKEYLESAKYSFQFEVLEHADKKNKGRQSTRNLALRISKQSFILFLDSDLQVNKDWIDTHLSELKSSPITIGRVHFTNYENPWVDYYNSRGYNTNLSKRKIDSRYYISANTGFRKEVFVDVGLMDESIKEYGGDAEFAFRLIQFGFKSLTYLPNAISFGLESKTVKQAVSQYELFSSNLLQNLIKRYPNNQDYFNYSKLKKLSFIKFNNLNYLAEILDNEKPGLLTRFGIRILLTLALIKEIR